MQEKVEQQKIDTAAHFNTQVAEWQASLPVFLSGAIHSSSLIAVFRRQLTVLRLAHAHALMLINRPLLLCDSAPASGIEKHVNTCLSAAKSSLDLVLEFASERHMFPAFWFTQVSMSVRAIRK